MQQSPGPPRSIARGDVVVTYSDELGEWTAAQVTGVGYDDIWRSGVAAVLELDWSGPEPRTLADLGELRPLVLSHHAHEGQLSHCNFGWLLPRGARVLGNAPLVVEAKPLAYAKGWRLGSQLDAQRRWDRGERLRRHPGHRRYTVVEMRDVVAESEPNGDVWRLDVTGIDSLDCSELVALFPNLTCLHLSGHLGTLTDAAALGELAGLRHLFISDLFGMTASDVVGVSSLPRLETVALDSIPADYATAMRRAWTPEVPNGTDVEIRGARRPEWVAENRANPLRQWDGRSHIPAARYRRSVVRYNQTRQEVVTALGTGQSTDLPGRLYEIGRTFADGMNAIDGVRNPFIETEEREELLAALDQLVDEVESTQDRSFAAERNSLLRGADDTRTW